jgi:hypothetical protein
MQAYQSLSVQECDATAAGKRTTAWPKNPSFAKAMEDNLSFAEAMEDKKNPTCQRQMGLYLFIVRFVGVRPLQRL